MLKIKETTRIQLLENETDERNNIAQSFSQLIDILFAYERIWE